MPLEFRSDELTPGQSAAIAAEAVRVSIAEGPRIAVSALIDAVGLRPALRNDEYYEAELDYCLALLYAKANDPHKSAEHVRRARIPPAGGGRQLFSDHLRDAIELSKRRLAAQARGMPSFFIASMPRAASATLTQTIATMLDLPLFRISLNSWLNRDWLNAVSPGGAMLHDHFGASEFNLEVLRSGGVRELFVLIRDPRAAAASIYQHVWRERLSPAQDHVDRESEIMKFFQNYYVPWLQDWIDLAGNPTAVIRLRWIDSRDVRNNMIKVWRQFVDALAALYPAILAYESKDLPNVTANFVKGDDESWRSLVGVDKQAKMWDLISLEMRELLALRP
jgi:hypothetical protein